MKSRYILYSLIAVIILNVAESYANEQANVQIAFEVNNTVCIINADDSERTCFPTHDDIVNRHAVWSPDGTRLVYHSTEREEYATYIYDLRQETASRLPEDWYVYDWSPDGAFLLAAKDDADEGDTEIYKLRSDGSEAQKLTDNKVSDFAASWSPDGTKIAYLSGEFPEATLMIMSSTGQVLSSLTAYTTVNRSVTPSWSPESDRIAFVINSDMQSTNQTSDIYVVDIDDNKPKRLTHTERINLDPRWSPNGTQIVFFGYVADAFDRNSEDENLSEVYIMMADGSHLTNLTQNPGLDYQPSWSSDGEWIAFASTRIWESEDFRAGIFIMRSDGSDVQMVTNEPPLMDGGHEPNKPAWRPMNEPCILCNSTN